MKCEATTNPTLWWKPGMIDFPQCSRSATVEIDGIHMCLQHAGTIAVQKLVSLGMAKIVKTDYSPLCALGKKDRFANRI